MVWEWRLADSRRTGRDLYGDEKIPPQPPTEKTPKLLRAMRSLVKTSTNFWQSRSELFLKQARLMANYEDDYDYQGTVNQYFPTYDSLTDPELRGYFTWRTKVRRGAVERRGMSYAALYVYELLALVGCTSPMDAYERLHSFGHAYGALDPQILRYLKDWERALIIYYGLSPALLEEHDGAVQERRQDDAVYVMLHQEEHTPEEIMAAVCTLSSYRLERSKLYRTHTAEADTIVLRVLARVKEYYEKHRICDFFSDCIARSCTRSVDLFASAVFHPPHAEEDRIYAVHPLRQYECTGGVWQLRAYERTDGAAQRIGGLLRGVDTQLREHYGLTEIRLPQLLKWQWKIIGEETAEFFAAQREIEARRVHLDFSQLDRIRADAAVTEERLIVDEEDALLPVVGEDISPPMPEQSLPPPAVQSAATYTNPQRQDTPSSSSADHGLTGVEKRLLCALLTGGALDWVRAEGQILSVLVDGINEKLYEDFSDTVIEGEPPAVVEDYWEELAGRYRHGIE
ncbi:TerB N-terminal domain-containing protein [uncultured Selenomonas sp.]|uniref:TerB N-terminal domain-containing protein n=1 Tax=uncultured Selenomonas sp. TaxID=159275 RepID=UPI0028E7AAE6|nr:TerB N-terminal domain-containing protein [uncultured Selenomonas sp.]